MEGWAKDLANVEDCTFNTRSIRIKNLRKAVQFGIEEDQKQRFMTDSSSSISYQGNSPCTFQRVCDGTVRFDC